MATLTFFKLNRVIQVDDPVEGTAVTVQELVNAIRDYEEEVDFLDYSHICNAFGKQDLGGGVQVGITLELINDWRIQFESPGAPPTINVYVRAGNLVAVNSFSNNPIKASDYVTVIIAQSTSPSIITPPEDLNMLYLIESLRGRHATLGSIFYWDPTNGLDTNDGTQPAEAKATFAAAQALATAGANDIIFCLANDASGITTVDDEVLNITVPSLKVRGPGYSFQLKPSAITTDVVTIGADNVEVSGFYIEPKASGTGHGIKIYTASGTVDDTLVKDCWIKSAPGNGIDVSNATRTTIDTCAIETTTGKGIQFGNSTSLSKVRQCIISGSTGDGVDLTGTGITDNIFEGNLIYNNTGIGLDINSGVVRTIVRLHNNFTGNSASTENDGTGTYIETGGAVTPDDIASIVDGVWDEVITTGHAIAGSAAKVLKDAKTRATLASIK